jgi:hypothetical protein
MIFDRGHMGGHMTPEELYRRFGRLIEVPPPPPTAPELSPEMIRWLGQATALVKETGSVVLQTELGAAIGMLNMPNRRDYFQSIMITLHSALAMAEINAPSSAQGAFIPVGTATNFASRGSFRAAQPL